jgi:DNA helicase HerA-like ATPase
MTNKLGFTLWLQMIKKIPSWELIIVITLLASVIFFGAVFIFTRIHRERIFHAFEKSKLKRKDLDRAFDDAQYVEITIPKNSQATAFQVQQKILKAFHSTFADPIEGAHGFSPIWYFFQKMFRLWKVSRARQVFFTMQIWAQYPFISFRLNIPTAHFERIEKAIFNAYPNAEINHLDKSKVLSDIAPFHKSYLSYGQSSIEGKFYHRVRTIKDVSSDPVDSVISTMESLSKGQFMAYNITVSPTSHFFNQIIHHWIEEQDRADALPENEQKPQYKKKTHVSELAFSLSTAMIEKMKASLFQVVISYWAICSSPEEAEAKLENIQAVLNEVNQKNMNMLKHRRLLTNQVEDLNKRNELKSIISMRPVLRQIKSKYWPFCIYENSGQIVSDGELYSFWHLPNLTNETVSSVKVTKFKKLPASQAMREFSSDFFVDLGNANFRMQEETPLGVPTWDDMKKHIYILGGTGSGKSETLKRILDNLLKKEGEEQAALLIVDPKNDFATDLLTMIPDDRAGDVIYFNPPKQKEKPLSFPFFSRFSGEKTDDERIEFLVSIMKRFVQIDSAFSWGPELENILRQLFATAYFLPEQSLSGLDLLLHEPAHIRNILKYLPPRLQKFWSGSILKRTDNDLAKYLATTNNKIGKILDYPEFMNIVDRLETKITFEEMINTGKIFIANLGSCSEQMKKYYSVYLTAHIAEAIFGQARLSNEERKPAVFVVDEFQRVASDIFETLFSEVRAFNTALVISNQFMGQLDPKIQKSIESNIATKIFMRTQSVDDAEIAKKILGDKVSTEDIINLPTGTAYLKTLVNGIPQEAMSMRVQRAKHPTDIAKDTEAIFIQETMERYGTPLEVIRQKRTTINTVYYSAAREQIFFEHMGRAATFNDASEEGNADINVADTPPTADIVPQPTIEPAAAPVSVQEKAGVPAVKTIFDF